MSNPAASRPATASSGVATLVRGDARPVRVLAVFRAAVYLGHDDGVVALVASDGIPHPNAIVVPDGTAAVPFAGVRTHQRGTVGGGRVVLPSLRLRVTRWTDPVPHLGRVDPTHLRALAREARERLVVATGPVPESLRHPAARVGTALLDGDTAGAVAAARRLLGYGPGLTPSGDDVLAGLLAAVPALERALHGPLATPLTTVTTALGGAIADLARDATTAVSAALLLHAARGEVAAPAAAVLHAFTGRGDLRAAVDGLLAVGSTSGRDLTVGLLAGADLVLAASAAPGAPATTLATASSTASVTTASRSTIDPRTL